MQFVKRLRLVDGYKYFFVFTDNGVLHSQDRPINTVHEADEADS